MSLFASLGSAEEVDHSLWGEGGLFGSNPVQDILDRGEGMFTLEDLLEEDELIQMRRAIARLEEEEANLVREMSAALLELGTQVRREKEDMR